MSQHPTHQMHDNSLASYAAMGDALGQRQQEVYDAYVRKGPMTDRDVLKEVKPGCEDPNYVRWAVTNLIQKCWAVEVGSVFDEERRRTVRIVRALTPEEHKAAVDRAAAGKQMELILAA